MARRASVKSKGLRAAKRAKAASPSKRSQPEASGRSKRGLLLALVVGLGVISAGTYVVSRPSPPPPIAIPQNLNQLKPDLIALITRHVTATEAEPRNAIQRATLGLVYQANAIWPEAIDCFKAATDLQPDEPLWPNRAAVAMAGGGDAESALAWLRHYAKRFPDYAALQCGLGNALLDAGKIDEAKAPFRRTIAIASKAAEGYVGLGEVLLGQGEYAGAAQQLEQAIQCDGSYKTAHYLLGVAYSRLGRIDEAKPRLTRGMNSTKRRMPDAWTSKMPNYAAGVGALNKQALQLMGKGRSAEAIKILHRALKLEPDSADLLLNLGIAHMDLKQLEDAQRIFAQAEQAAPGRFDVGINRAACAIELKQPALALTHINRAAELAPQSAHVHLVRGRTLALLGRYSEALDAFLTGVRYGPRNPELHQELGNAYLRLGDKRTAKSHFLALSDLLPAAWQPYARVAGICMDLNEWEEARTALHAAQQIAPNQPQLRGMAKRLSERQR